MIRGSAGIQFLKGKASGFKMTVILTFFLISAFHVVGCPVVEFGNRTTFIIGYYHHYQDFKLD